MKTIQFPRWAEVLGASKLPQKDRDSYKVTLRWYLGWCHRHSVGCNVESARDFIEWAQVEKQANEWMCRSCFCDSFSVVCALRCCRGLREQSPYGCMASRYGSVVKTHVN